jgi:hypothetical protein
MFTKLTRSGGHTYVQLVESFRDETGRPRQRTISTLGRLDESGGQVDSLLKGLLRAKGMPASMADTPQVAFESALALGDVWALDQLWKELGFDALAGVFRKARYTTPVEHAIRVMVFNRLCDADSKLPSSTLPPRFSLISKGGLHMNQSLSRGFLDFFVV